MSETKRIFASDTSERIVRFAWSRTVRMCWSNVRNRRGRFLLTLLGVEPGNFFL